MKKNKKPKFKIVAPHGENLRYIGEVPGSNIGEWELSITGKNRDVANIPDVSKPLTVIKMPEKFERKIDTPGIKEILPPVSPLGEPVSFPKIEITPPISLIKEKMPTVQQIQKQPEPTSIISPSIPLPSTPTVNVWQSLKRRLSNLFPSNRRIPLPEKDISPGAPTTSPLPVSGRTGIPSYHFYTGRAPLIATVGIPQKDEEDLWRESETIPDSAKYQTGKISPSEMTERRPLEITYISPPTIPEFPTVSEPPKEGVKKQKGWGQIIPFLLPTIAALTAKKSPGFAYGLSSGLSAYYKQKAERDAKIQEAIEAYKKGLESRQIAALQFKYATGVPWSQRDAKIYEKLTGVWPGVRDTTVSGEGVTTMSPVISAPTGETPTTNIPIPTPRFAEKARAKEEESLSKAAAEGKKAAKEHAKTIYGNSILTGEMPSKEILDSVNKTPEVWRIERNQYLLAEEGKRLTVERKRGIVEGGGTEGKSVGGDTKEIGQILKVINAGFSMFIKQQPFSSRTRGTTEMAREYYRQIKGSMPKVYGTENFNSAAEKFLASYGVKLVPYGTKKSQGEPNKEIYSSKLQGFH